MPRARFRLWHSLVATAALLVVEGAATASRAAAVPVVLVLSLVGAAAMIYAATEAIEEVRGSRAMLAMLTAVMAQFVLFFAFQYWFLLIAQPASFPTLGADPSSLLLASVMAFVFNPLAAPATAAARTLLLIDTLGALGLVLFVLQNVSELRRKSLD